jgi:hypothetical protein
MAERARHHPHRSADMSAALEILDGWLDARQESGAAPPPAPLEERQQRQLLSSSAANAHARARCASDAEHAELVAADRRTALGALRSAAGEVPFSLSATAFVSIFGGPGEHGYGQHRCEDASSAGLAGWRCTCAFTRRHVVTVSSAAAASMRIGTQSSGFRLIFDGGEQTATLRGAPGRGQSTLTAFFQKVPAQSRSAARLQEPKVNRRARSLESGGGPNMGSHALLCGKRPRLRR